MFTRRQYQPDYQDDYQQPATSNYQAPAMPAFSWMGGGAQPEQGSVGVGQAAQMGGMRGASALVNLFKKKSPMMGGWSGGGTE